MWSNILWKPLHKLKLDIIIQLKHKPLLCLYEAHE